MAALASSGLSQHPEHAAFKAPSRHGSAMPLGKLGGWCRGRATAPWKLPLGALQSLVLAAITQDRGVVLKSANRRLQPSLMSRGKSSQTLTAPATRDHAGAERNTLQTHGLYY